MSAIVTSLNHYSRWDDLPKTKCKVNTIIDNCLIMLNNQLKGKVEVINNYSNQTHLVLASERKLHQAFLNIIANAEQTIEKKGTIIIETDVAKNYCVVNIRDSGTGIDPSIIEKIFDPFFTTKPPGKGTGLGLAITYNIIQEHNGTIEFESEPGNGTNVKVKLPIFEKDEDNDTVCR